MKGTVGQLASWSQMELNSNPGSIMVYWFCDHWACLFTCEMGVCVCVCVCVHVRAQSCPTPKTWIVMLNLQIWVRMNETGHVKVPAWFLAHHRPSGNFSALISLVVLYWGANEEKEDGRQKRKFLSTRFQDCPSDTTSEATQVHDQLSLHWWFCILEFNHLGIGFHCSIYWKKSMYKWILEAQTHVVQRNDSHTC